MEPLPASEPEESVATVRIATVSAALRDSPAEGGNQGTAERTKRTRQSASEIRIRGGFECNWLYPWRGRNDCRFIFPREHGVEHFCDAGVFRHEMANGTGEICFRTEDKYDLWRDPDVTNFEAIRDVLKPYDANVMRRYPVSRKLNDSKIGDADSASPVTLGTPTQERLF